MANQFDPNQQDTTENDQPDWSILESISDETMAALEGAGTCHGELDQPAMYEPK